MLTCWISNQPLPGKKMNVIMCDLLTFDQDNLRIWLGGDNETKIYI